VGVTSSNWNFGSTANS